MGGTRLPEYVAPGKDGWHASPRWRCLQEKMGSTRLRVDAPPRKDRGHPSLRWTGHPRVPAIPWPGRGPRPDRDTAARSSSRSRLYERDFRPRLRRGAAWPRLGSSHVGLALLSTRLGLRRGRPAAGALRETSWRRALSRSALPHPRARRAAASPPRRERRSGACDRAGRPGLAVRFRERRNTRSSSRPCPAAHSVLSGKLAPMPPRR